MYQESLRLNVKIEIGVYTYYTYVLVYNSYCLKS